jgi:hypothetical protein
MERIQSKGYVANNHRINTIDVESAFKGIRWCNPCRIVYGGCHTGEGSLIDQTAETTGCYVSGNAGIPGLDREGKRHLLDPSIEVTVKTF